MRKKLDYTKSHLDEPLAEWVDGFLLGDGHLAQTSPKSACAGIGSSNINWTRYSMKGLVSYEPSQPRENWTGAGVGTKKYQSWQSWTLSHPDLRHHWCRWYSTGKKVVPQDVRLTGTSLRLWYLGDGSFDGGFVTVAAYDFSVKELERITTRLEAECGLPFTLHQSKGARKKLYLPAEYIGKFFDFIGKDCPVIGYEHKFEVDPKRWLTGLSDAARQLKVNYAWVQNFIRSGRIEVKHHGGWTYLTSEEFEKLKSIRDTEYRPRTKGRTTSGRLTAEQVLRSLRAHPRRLTSLIAAAKINPHRTLGGHYRFTKEEIEAMRPFAAKRRSFPCEV